MSNLKKILALVLALVMSFSVMSVSSAAFKDAKDFTADYEEAVEVLTGLGVIKGYENGTFQPKGTITRAEAAAIIYRIVTGDVANAHVDIYAGYGKFADVAAKNWAAGYIGFCANGEYIKGYSMKGDGTDKFGPQDPVTGYQMLVMLLRALGYGKNNEFVGEGWDIRTSTLAEGLGLLNNVSTSHALLKQPATRELVCELVFSAMTKTAMVNHTLLQGYDEITVIDDKGTFTKNDDVVYDWTLGYETFGLICTDDHRDIWGRPSWSWVRDNDRDITDYPTAAKYRVATFALEAVDTFTAPKAECDIAATLGVTGTAPIYNIFVNGESNDVEAYDYNLYFNTDTLLTAKDVKNMIGEQGRLVEFYENGNGYDVVMIDTFFAIVEDVTETIYDKNKHVVEYAELDLAIYTNEGVDYVTLEAEEWEYKEDDTLLINAWTDAYYDESIYSADYTFIIGEPESFVGKQTAFTTDPVHEVNGKEIPDAYQFVLNVDTLDETNRTWYYDQYKNLIATMEIVDEYQYGTISAIAWTDSFSALVDGYALAKITFMDGSQKELKVVSINNVKLEEAAGKDAIYDSATGEFKVSSKQYNGGFENAALYEIDIVDGYAYLTEQILLEDGAKIVPGVPKLGTADYYQGKSTMYLVWNGKTYETYKGLKNVPEYVANDNTFWVADIIDKGGDVVEYIFVNPGIGPNTDSTKNHTYFSYADDTLRVKTNLKNGIKTFVITGGYLNGELAPITVTADNATQLYDQNAKVMFILNNQGKLLDIDMKNGTEFVNGDGYEVVTNYYRTINTLTGKPSAVYAGAMAYAILDDGDLRIDGETYDVDGAKVFSFNGKTLERNWRNGEGYVWVVYSYAGNTKHADFVYIVENEPAGMTNVIVNGESVVLRDGEQVKVPAASADDAENSTGVKVTGYNYARAEYVVAWELYVAYGEKFVYTEDMACDFIEFESNYVALSIDGDEYAIAYSETAATIEALLAEAGYELATDAYIALDGVEVAAGTTFIANDDLVFTTGTKVAEDETEDEETPEEV